MYKDPTIAEATSRISRISYEDIVYTFISQLLYIGLKNVVFLLLLAV